jgi:hypothetical protein
MLVSKDELRTGIETCIRRYMPTIDKQKEVAALLYEDYKIPIRLSMELMGFRKDIDEIGEQGIFVAFCLFKGASAYLDAPDLTKKFFTESEIKYYITQQFPDNNIQFPLVIKSIQVADDQWIGSISAKELCRLGECGLIRYEELTQRVLRKIVRGENVFYKISLDRRAVKAIKMLLISNKYVPNTITLNIPLGEGDFFYNEETMELVINKLDYFNIVDGYHRYRAIADLVNSDKDFDYSLELRIVNFDVDKANSFIWQEDQKNKMARVDSESYNPNKLANRIVSMVNNSSVSLANGLIVRNTGIITPADMASCIDYLWLCGKIENESRKAMVVSNEIITGLNHIIESDYSVIDKAWSFKEVAVAMFLTHEAAADISNMYKIILNNIQKEENKNFYTRKFTKRTETFIRQKYDSARGGEGDV